MGKYSKLGDILTNTKEEEINFTFHEVEKLLGFPLPSSARKYRPWWANDKTHVHAFDGWLSVGWEVCKIDMTEEFVKFCKGSETKMNGKKRTTSEADTLTASKFELKAREIMSNHLGLELEPGKKEKWPKLFDYVSKDYQIIGDAKYYSMVRGVSIPPAKFATIAEHVWFLEKLDAQLKFLVFGNDIRVPQEWLSRYGHLVEDVEFYFIGDDEIPQRLFYTESKDQEESAIPKKKSLKELVEQEDPSFFEFSQKKELSLADRIRDFTGKLIREAREQGKHNITIRTGDIHAAMNLSNRMPAVCGALDTKKFRDEYNLTLAKREGPHQGANVYITYIL